MRLSLSQLSFLFPTTTTTLLPPCSIFRNSLTSPLSTSSSFISASELSRLSRTIKYDLSLSLSSVLSIQLSSPSPVSLAGEEERDETDADNCDRNLLPGHAANGRGSRCVSAGAAVNS
ncbi:hypothetical protein HOY80DRAFT_947107 [Tuber brumale]|nr:hypothetical protein HOY80DRAFT_947107 [Tuber brumale]